METLIHLVPKTIAEKLVWERSLNSELQKKLSEALIEKGVLKSEIDEWKFKFTELKIKFEATDYKRDLNLRNQYIKGQETIKALRKQIDKLGNELVQIKLKQSKV